MVRELAGIPATGAGWQDHFLERLGLLTLLIEGYRRGTELPEATRRGLACPCRTIVTVSLFKARALLPFLG